MATKKQSTTSKAVKESSPVKEASPLAVAPVDRVYSIPELGVSVTAASIDDAVKQAHKIEKES